MSLFWGGEAVHELENARAPAASVSGSKLVVLPGGVCLLVLLLFARFPANHVSGYV